MIKLSWLDFYDFYREKVSEDAPNTEDFIKDKKDYQQKEGGYIKNALACGIIKKNKREERKEISQSWHFFVSYLYITKLQKNVSELKNKDQKQQVEFVIRELNVDTNREKLKKMDACFLPCVELTLWMAEVAGVLKSIDPKKLNIMRDCIKKRKRQGVCARCIWVMVNAEIFNSRDYIWNQICCAVNEEKNNIN